MAKTKTSDTTPVITDNGAVVNTFTQVTEGNDALGNIKFDATLIKYDTPAGDNPISIGFRDANNGNITFDSTFTKDYNIDNLANFKAFEKVSTNQIFSLEKAFDSGTETKQAIKNVSGKGNESTDKENAEASNPAPTNSRLEIGKGQGRKQYAGNIRYPIDLKDQQDTLKITILEYVASKPTGGFSFSKETKGKPIGNVTLPAPGTISDTRSAIWGTGTMTPIEAAGLGAVKGLMAGGWKDAETSLMTTLGAVQQNGESVKTALENAIAGSIVGNNELLQRTEGAILNPNMELLFTGPVLRPFGFTYKLSPRSERESSNVRSIIRMFKQSMSPQRTSSNLFLRAPNIYKLEFISPGGGRGKSHKFLPKFKNCALTSFTVDYTPDGSYMTYDNSSMVAYNLSFSFQEIEPIYNSDMGMSDYSDIGY